MTKTTTESGKFRLTNVGRAPRIIYSATGEQNAKPVIIPPGGSAVAFLSERQERDLRKGSSLRLESTNDELTPRLGEHHLAKAPPPKPVDDDTPVEVFTAQELVDKSDETSYAELLTESKKTLGSDFPTGRAGGQPRKKEIVTILRRKAKEESGDLVDDNE